MRADGGAYNRVRLVVGDESTAWGAGPPHRGGPARNSLVLESYSPILDMDLLITCTTSLTCTVRETFVVFGCWALLEG